VGVGPTAIANNWPGELDVGFRRSGGSAGDSNSAPQLLLIDVGQVEAAALGVSAGRGRSQLPAGLLTQGRWRFHFDGLAARFGRLAAGQTSTQRPQPVQSFRRPPAG